MKFRAHETFFIRKGWLYKGIRGVDANAGVFIDKKENPMDILGMGSNMVKSLRYWMQATGLTVEEAYKGKARLQKLTPLGEIIKSHDPYMEELGTLCLVHYKLASNKELATAWYFFFNHFSMGEFQKDDFVTALANYAAMANEAPAMSSLEDDFNCVINTYVERKKINPVRVLPESNIESPLSELGLIGIGNSQDRSFKKMSPKHGTISPYILLAVIRDQCGDKEEVRISDLLTSPCNIGRIFNLDIITMMQELNQLAAMDLISIVRTAGLDVVKIMSKLSFYDCVEAYYLSLND